MPTYEFFCKNCEERREISIPITEFESVKKQICSCGSTMIQRFFVGNIVFKEPEGRLGPGQESTWPGKCIQRQREDEYIKSVTKRARELKQSGKVKMEDHLSFKDVESLSPE